MGIFDLFWRGPSISEADIDPNDNSRALPPPPRPAARAERAVSAAADVSTYQTGRAAYPTFTAANAVASGMRLSIWAYRCIQLVAQSAGSLPWKVQRKGSDGAWKDIETPHPLTNLINTPNEHWSRADLISLVAMHLLLAGRAYVSKVRAPVLGDAVFELWVLNPDKVTPIKSRTHYISAYEHTQGDHTKQRYAPGDICHVRLADPADPHNGLGPTEAAAYTIDTEVEAQKWQRNQIKNDCKPGGVLAFDRPMTEAQRESAEGKIEDRFQGGANAGKILVVGGAGKYYRASNTPQEMDFVDSRKMSREEVCGAYGVPPVLVGILDRATYSNYETALKVFWQLTMVPLMDVICGALNRSLVPEYGDPASLRLVYDTSAIAVLQHLDRDTVLSAATLHRMGVPFNAINDRLSMSFPDLQYGDVSYLASGRPLGDDGIPLSNATPEGADVAEDAL